MIERRRVFPFGEAAIARDETHDSGEYRYARGQLRRNRERVTVLGLNENHNDVMSFVFACHIRLGLRRGVSDNHCIRWRFALLYGHKTTCAFLTGNALYDYELTFRAILADRASQSLLQKLKHLRR
jgi:hypothetical protein